MRKRGHQVRKEKAGKGEDTGVQCFHNAVWREGDCSVLLAGSCLLVWKGHHPVGAPWQPCSEPEALAKALSPEFWGRGWRNILGLCGDESPSTLPKPSLFQVLDRFKPEPQWDWKVGVRLGEMEFGNILPLNSKMSGYGKAQILRNSKMTETKVQTSDLFQVPVLTLTKSMTLGNHLNLGVSVFLSIKWG